MKPQQNIPSPLVGEGREGGPKATRRRPYMLITFRPPPLTPPHKGERNGELCAREKIPSPTRGEGKRNRA
jgi:hypothetical protein